VRYTLTVNANFKPHVGAGNCVGASTDFRFLQMVATSNSGVLGKRQTEEQTPPSARQVYPDQRTSQAEGQLTGIYITFEARETEVAPDRAADSGCGSCMESAVSLSVCAFFAKWTAFPLTRFLTDIKIRTI